MKFIIAYLLTLLAFALVGQTTFFRTFDVQNHSSDRGWDLLIDEGGFVIATGSLCWENIEPSCTGLIKCDFNGDFLWKRTYEGFIEAPVNCLLILEDGNYAMTGNVYQGNPGDGVIFLMKIDKTNGDSLWIKYYNSPAADASNSLSRLPDGSFVIYADGNSSGDFMNNKSMIKTTSAGDLTFHKDYMDDFRESLWGNLEVLKNGDLLSGYKVWTWDDNEPWTALTKYDSLGNELWTKRYYKSTNISPPYVRILSDETYGLFCSRDTFIPGCGCPVYLSFMKIDTIGTVIGEYEIYRGDYYSYLNNVVLDSDGNILGAGNTYLEEIEEWAGWLIKISPQGQILWQRFFWEKSLAPGNVFWFEDIEPTPWGGIAISGTISLEQSDGDAMLLVLDENGCFEPGCDSTIQFLLTTSSEVVSGQERGMQVFPNPARKEVFLKTNQTGKGELSIFDLTGKMLFRKRIEEYDQKEHFNVSFLLPGVYYLIFQSDEALLYHQRLIISR